jgi:hypothetical protein
MLRVFFKETNAMKKYVLLLTAAILFGMVAPVLAQEGDLHGDFGYTWDSFHMWRGFETWGHTSGSNTFIDLDFFGSGFGMSIEDHMSNGGGYWLGRRDDYTLFYQNKIAAGDSLETDYKLSYVYYNYPQTNERHSATAWDLQEFNVLFAWPGITGVKGLVPAYCIVKLWPSMDNSPVGAGNPNGGSASGWAHIFMLNYALPLENISSETPKQTLNFHTELVWNDGIDPRPYGGYHSSDWSDFVMGVSTDFDLGSGFIFTPGINHQITMEDDNNRGVAPNHSITWATMTIKYKW